jgi:small subunit ribosomal protein S16
MGRKKHPFYRLVVLDSRVRRDGDYIDKLGHYNPFVEPREVTIDHDKAIEWLQKGAGMSDTARSLLRNEGVLYRWHLQKSGLAVGEIESKVEEYRARHGSRLQATREQLSQSRAAELQKREDAEKAYLKAKIAKAEGSAPEEEAGEAAPAEASAPQEADEESKSQASETAAEESQEPEKGSDKS